jgi:4-amino-4-deoxy-L-arabinose transferase-like glycosyltransferase
VPWITSLVYRAVGHRYDVAVLVQAAIGALVPLLVVALAVAIFGAGVGWVAGWLTAVNPLIVFFSGHLLTENAFTALILLALLLSVSWVKGRRRRGALAAGIVWGLAALARPLALPLPVIVAAWAWTPLGHAIGARRRTEQMALLLMGLALAVGPWTLRNALVLDAFVPVSTNSGRVLLEGYNPRSWDDPALRGGGAIDVTAEPYATLIGLPEVEADRQSRAEAMRFARERADELPRMALAKLARFWRLSAEGGGTGTWQREGSLPARLLARFDPVLIWSMIVFPFALWGAFHVLRGPQRRSRSLPLVVMLYFSLVAMVFWGGLRPRAPIEPLIVLVAALGFEDVRRRLHGRPSPSV